MIAKFFHAHPQIVLAALAVVFFAAIVACYSWAIGAAFGSIDGALVAPVSQTVPMFNLSAAANLDFRGAAPTSSSASGAGASGQ